MKRLENGFTLIELLVVIAIIGVLASVVLASLNAARDKAQIVKAAAELREIHKVVSAYIADTGQVPTICSASCDASNDPFLNDLGVAGWDGPYMTLWSRAHPWGGSYSYASYDAYNDGTMQLLVYLDDDRPATDSGDNQGLVTPISLLEDLDTLLDDGDLSQGRFIGDARDAAAVSGGPLSAVGEGILIFDY